MEKTPAARSETSAKGKGSAFTFFLLPVLLTAFLFALSEAADDVNAKSAVVIEASTGRILYGKNPNLWLFPASTAKLMTAIVALDNLQVNDMVVISERAVNISPIKAALHAGDRVSVESLLQAALIKSANDAAYALSEATAGSEERFVELMNQKSLALGLTDTLFVNATGLPGQGQHITGYDLARLLRHALKYPLIREIINTKVGSLSTGEGREIFIKNSNRLLWADDSVVGGKTGYTRQAKHCFVCASEQANDTVIVAILGAPSREVLWRETEELIAKGFAVLRGKEEPMLYFSKTDYRNTVEYASYQVKSPDDRGPAKAKKKIAKKRNKNSAGMKSLQGHKGKKDITAQARKRDGVKG